MARLTAALHFYETKYPQGDEEGLCGLADGAMKPEKDGEIVQLKVFVDIVVLWCFITCFDCCRPRLLIYNLGSVKKKLLS